MMKIKTLALKCDFCDNDTMEIIRIETEKVKKTLRLCPGCKQELGSILYNVDMD